MYYSKYIHCRELWSLEIGRISSPSSHSTGTENLWGMLCGRCAPLTTNDLLFGTGWWMYSNGNSRGSTGGFGGNFSPVLVNGIWTNSGRNSGDVQDDLTMKEHLMKVEAAVEAVVIVVVVVAVAAVVLVLVLVVVAVVVVGEEDVEVIKDNYK